VAKRIILILAAMLLFTLSGCSEKRYDPSKVEQITLTRIVWDNPKYEVFVITPDYVVKQYDFTLYWVENAYDYFTDPLPPESEYTLNEWPILHGTWNHIVEVLKQNRFYSLPKKIGPANGNDYPNHYIEVTENGMTHQSGGYGAFYQNKRFRSVWDGVFESLEAGKANRITSDRIVSFSFRCTGDVVLDNCYEIEKDEGAYFLQSIRIQQSGITPPGIPINEDVLRDLQDIVVKYNIVSWDGFYETAPDNMRSTANVFFTIYIGYDDESTICAYGDHVLPYGYREAENALVKFFNNLITNKLHDMANLEE